MIVINIEFELIFHQFVIYQFVIYQIHLILFETKPSILINKSEGKSIKNGFCAHEIILKSNELYNHLYKYPLIVKFIDKNSFINLCNLLKTNKSASNLRFIDKYYTIYVIKNNNNLYEFETFNDLNNIQCESIGNTIK